MRIIAGEKRGLRLNSPIGRDVRPTKDNVKEAVFGSIQFSIQGASFLDLFSGTGGIGIEALSRGASFVCFADNSRESLGVVNKNIESAGYTDDALVMCGDYSTVIVKLSGKYRFDYVYIDPPYSASLYHDVLNCISENDILNKDAVIILESDEELFPSLSKFEIIKKKRFGKCHITYMRFIDNE